MMMTISEHTLTRQISREGDARTQRTHSQPKLPYSQEVHLSVPSCSRWEGVGVGRGGLKKGGSDLNPKLRLEQEEHYLDPLAHQDPPINSVANT